MAQCHPGICSVCFTITQITGGTPNRSASRTSSATDLRPTLRIRRPRWTLTFWKFVDGISGTDNYLDSILNSHVIAVTN